MNNQKITGLAVPVASTDAANKEYVDAAGGAASAGSPTPAGTYFSVRDEYGYYFCKSEVLNVNGTTQTIQNINILQNCAQNKRCSSVGNCQLISSCADIQDYVNCGSNKFCTNSSCNSYPSSIPYSDPADNMNQPNRFANTDQHGNYNSDLVYDSATGLVWEKQGDTQANWNSAILGCKNLSLGGFNDWRLPDITELISIMDLTDFTAPMIYEGSGGFSATVSNDYWSSTTLPNNATYAYYASFSYGNSSYYSKTNNSYVRCVRQRQ